MGGNEAGIVKGTLRGAETGLGAFESLALAIQLALGDHVALTQGALALKLLLGGAKGGLSGVEGGPEVGGIELPDQITLPDDLSVKDREIDQSPRDIEGKTHIVLGSDLAREAAKRRLISLRQGENLYRRGRADRGFSPFLASRHRQ